MFSARSALERRENRLARALSAARAAGRAPLDLTRSNPTDAGWPTPPELLAALGDARAGTHRPAPFGLPEARAAIAEHMSRRGPPVAPERVILTASTSEAYAFLFKLLCDPGDGVLLPAPGYPLFEHLCRLEGVRARDYRLRYDGRWHLDHGELARVRDERTRALVTIHPNNPTGSYLQRDELPQLARLGLPWISDEVFAPYAFEREAGAAASAREARSALVFSLHGLSKLVAMPQLKLSWICVEGPDDAVTEALGRMELIADAFLSVATPVQLAAATLLEGGAAAQAAIRARVRHNHLALGEACAGTAVTRLNAEGGWYATLRLPALMDDEAWALSLLEEADVRVQPGYFYDFDAGPYLVVSLLTPEAVLTEGIARLLTHVSARAAGG